MNKFECNECGTKYSSPETTPPPGIKWSDGHVCTPKPVNKQIMKRIINKQKSTKNLICELNGEKYNLGKLVVMTSSYCAASKKYVPTYKCIKTGKTFTDVTKLSYHLAILLKGNEANTQV